MSAVMNMIVSMKELESELSMQDNQMTSLKVDDLEAVKQVKGTRNQFIFSDLYLGSQIHSLLYSIEFTVFLFYNQ